MGVRRTERVGGWLLVEDDRLHWSEGVRVDGDLKVMLCGEISHARWVLYRTAWQIAVRHDLERVLAGFAQRVGVEYSSVRTTTTRENRETS